jgi:hypothetical protein
VAALDNKLSLESWGDKDFERSTFFTVLVTVKLRSKPVHQLRTVFIILAAFQGMGGQCCEIYRSPLLYLENFPSLAIPLIASALRPML